MLKQNETEYLKTWLAKRNKMISLTRLALYVSQVPCVLSASRADTYLAILIRTAFVIRTTCFVFLTTEFVICTYPLRVCHPHITAFTSVRTVTKVKKYRYE